MGKKRFDIEDFAAALGGVSESNTEQIEYIDLSLIDEDKGNFYSLTGIAELASSIEIAGLQQPIRVRNGENGRVTIVSGHRRRAALALLVEEGKEAFRRVPCIRELDEVSEDMRQLRLILANSGTRVLSSAEIGEQAAQVEMLLYRLKEAGHEFPGRMRDQVAAACRVSATKLAKLKVIREKLQQPFQEQYQRGELTEQAAYALARLPLDIQKDVALALGAKAKPIVGGCAEHLLEYAEDYYSKAANRVCPSGGFCGNLLGMLKGTAGAPYSWHYCQGGCCLNCGQSESCKGRCAHAKKRTADRKAEQIVQQKKQKAEADKRSERYRAESIKNAKRLMPLIVAAGMKDADTLKFDHAPVRVSDIRRFSNPVLCKDDYLYGVRFVPNSPENLRAVAKRLNCTTDYLLGLTDAPTPVGGVDLAAWRTDEGYPSMRWIVGVFDLGNGQRIRQLIYVKGGALWFSDRLNAPHMDMKPVKWFLLPEDKEET